MKAVRVADNILALPVEFGGEWQYLTVLTNGNRYTLIDTGITKHYRTVIQSLANTAELAGMHLFGVLVTSANEHAIGNLSSFVADYPELVIMGTHEVLDPIQLPFTTNIKFIADETVLEFNGELLVLVNVAGMLALYHIATKTMIAGDRLILENGQLLQPTLANRPILDFPMEQLITKGGIIAGTQLAAAIGAIKEQDNG
ncbi:hypothetical protein EQG49_12575 [Periweissella cryptocerci]|uniref:MBL fold metallo-hydrolase n=1 Tax=Periweissella cryptocerci TaxID=2506420 RepID=A0A4P6YWJ4_9LACO|nr:hypothetical protein [Periweissella cryptocerci]QBO37232.1 hypothetical protein EQG49_12575 [Periweissella cryptocerci]